MDHIAVEPVGHGVHACAPLAEFGRKPSHRGVVDRGAGAVLSKGGICLNQLIEVFSGTTHVRSPKALLRLLAVESDDHPVFLRYPEVHRATVELPPWRRMQEDAAGASLSPHVCLNEGGGGGRVMHEENIALAQPSNMTRG